VILGHLSKENNRPEIAMAETEQTLAGRDVALFCAPEWGCLRLEIKEREECSL